MFNESRATDDIAQQRLGRSASTIGRGRRAGPDDWAKVLCDEGGVENHVLDARGGEGLGELGSHVLETHQERQLGQQGLGHAARLARCAEARPQERSAGQALPAVRQALGRVHGGRRARAGVHSGGTCSGRPRCRGSLGLIHKALRLGREAAHGRRVDAESRDDALQGVAAHGLGLVHHVQELVLDRGPEVREARVVLLDLGMDGAREGHDDVTQLPEHGHGRVDVRLKVEHLAQHHGHTCLGGSRRISDRRRGGVFGSASTTDEPQRIAGSRHGLIYGQLGLDGRDEGDGFRARPWDAFG